MTPLAPMPAPVLLLSTGRTGTRFFAELFARYGADLCAHHTAPGTRVLNVLSNMAVLGLPSRWLAERWLARTTIAPIRAEPARWVECNPFYFGSISVLRAAFPAARFVFLVRHPRQFCESHIRWERQRLPSRVANQLVPFWGPVPYHEQLLGLLGRYPQRVRYYAKVWSRRNEVILSQLDGDPQAITLRFEDIFGTLDGARRLGELFEALGIQATAPIDDAMLGRRANQTRRDAREPWNERCDAIVETHCGALMRRFGYEAEGRVLPAAP
jgi:hypothetical protein